MKLLLHLLVLKFVAFVLVHQNKPCPFCVGATVVPDPLVSSISAPLPSPSFSPISPIASSMASFSPGTHSFLYCLFLTFSILRGSRVLHQFEIWISKWTTEFPAFTTQYTKFSFSDSISLCMRLPFSLISYTYRNFVVLNVRYGSFLLSLLKDRTLYVSCVIRNSTRK